MSLGGFQLNWVC